MAVHHFTAADLTVVRGWQPIETFPRDRSMVEVRDAAGNLALAFWENERMVIGGNVDCPALGELTQWRYQEEG